MKRSTKIATGAIVGAAGLIVPAKAKLWTPEAPSIIRASNVPEFSKAMLPGFCVPMVVSAVAAAAADAWNPSDKNASITLSNSNRTASWSAGGTYAARGVTGKSSGKWYFEVTHTSPSGDAWVGVATSAQALNAYPDGSSTALGLYLEFGNVSGSTTASYSAVTDGTAAMIALDADNNKVWFGSGGTWFASGNPATNTGGLTRPSGTLFIFCGGNGNETVTIAATPTHSIPSGFTLWGP